MLDTNDILAKIGEINLSVVNLKAKPGDKIELNKIKECLNKIFPDSKCVDVIYTVNTDKMFFGIVTLPILSPNEILNIMTSDEDSKITTYKVELDSKLFSDMIDLSLDEITALIVHEVARLVNDYYPINNARYLIDKTVLDYGITLKMSEYVPYIEIIGYGIKEAARRSVSIFENNYLVPYYLDETYELTDSLRRAITKLENKGNLWDTEVDNKSIIVKWVVRLYTNILKYRIMSLHTLEKGIELTGSVLVVNEMKNIVKKLHRIDDYSLMQEASNIINFFNSTKNATLNALDRFKANGIKNYYDDYYEIQFEYNNMDNDRGTAVTLLHKINSRMSVIDDYISTEKVDPQTKKRLTELYYKYDELRKNIATTKLRPPQTLLIKVD
nr:MAG TPA: hypothetical protein [Caudoviricetes sp.]